MAKALVWRRMLILGSQPPSEKDARLPLRLPGLLHMRRLCPASLQPWPGCLALLTHREAHQPGMAQPVLEETRPAQ